MVMPKLLPIYKYGDECSLCRIQLVPQGHRVHGWFLVAHREAAMNHYPVSRQATIADIVAVLKEISKEDRALIMNEFLAEEDKNPQELVENE